MTLSLTHLFNNTTKEWPYLENTLTERSRDLWPLWKLMTFLTIENRQNIHSFIQSYTGQHSQFLQCVKWSTLVQIVKTIQCFSWSLLSRVNFALVVDILPNPSMFAKLSGSVGRWPGWPCTTTRSTRSTRTPSTGSPSRWRSRHSPRLLAFLPSPHSQHFSLNPNNSMGNGNISCFFIELGSAVQWKSFKPYPALCESRPTQCFPHALTVPLFWDSRQLFWNFRPRIFCRNSHF